MTPRRDCLECAGTGQSLAGRCWCALDRPALSLAIEAAATIAGAAIVAGLAYVALVLIFATGAP